MRPVPTNCIAAIAATAINAAMSAYSMAVTPDPSLISFKKSARNRVILGLIRTHEQIADQTQSGFGSVWAAARGDRAPAGAVSEPGENPTEAPRQTRVCDANGRRPVSTLSRQSAQRMKSGLL